VLNVLDDTVLASMIDGYPAGDMTLLIDSLRASGNKALEEASALAKKARVEVNTAMVEARGRPVSDLILADARKFGADLIVMGTHGRRGLNRLLLGSDAERVLRQASVPVLLVRAQQAERRRKT
jgi:nucleotide-binding universal stress UspA family protein